MSIERSHGKRSPRTPRAGDSPLPPGTVLADPVRDRCTGRFVRGNKAQRLRAVKAIARNVVGLNPAEVVPWLRPFVEMANGDARRLVEEHGAADDTALVRLAEDAAAAHAVFRGLLALGAKGDDRTALVEAKAWLREHRQAVLALKGEAREHAKARAMPGIIDGTELARRVAALRGNDAATTRPVQASTDGSVGEGDGDGEAAQRGAWAEGEGMAEEPDDEADGRNGEEETRVSSSASAPPPGLTVAPPTFSGHPTPPRRPMLVSNSRAMPAPPPPRTGQEHLDGGKPPLPFWVTRPDGSAVRSDNLPPAELQKLRAEGRLS